VTKRRAQLADRLELIQTQRRWWRNSREQVVDVARIPREYRVNLLRFLVRRAEPIVLVRVGDSLRPVLFYSDLALRKCCDEFLLLDPRAWMLEQPLVQHLRELIREDYREPPEAGLYTEVGFKTRCQVLIDAGVKPTPRTIASRRSLNGAQCRWRREVLEDNDYVKRLAA
jgi:hypothetical protein